ncbi:GNAT family N-acetyltransferase [Hyphobacterium marinum]|uniref:GNAT family N-acetyltransferase n=1 Tax=Hyphobacterium marinum TaxID=3116574 RepID=A0ABU7LXF8_9PROT|nr:GNAT family N-acetyltransferase [Hyphobacterium sp. Y6023]MEE2566249.1 GNAT family N-acetyltransferase [Hyphobacterium sp. Y6023]
MDRPSRPDGISIRDARPDEIEALSALCLRSKAHWGYDAPFIAACAPYLRLEPHLVADGCAFVAEDNAGRILGVCQIDPAGKSGTLDLLFIEPDAIGSGAGRALFGEAAARMKVRGECVMTILSDPDARGFYENMGARFIEDRPSDVFEGRFLPWLEYEV